MRPRIKEEFLLQVIREGMDIDPSPVTAQEWKTILTEASLKVPLYRIRRNLWMLVHVNELYTIHKNGQTYFAKDLG